MENYEVKLHQSYMYSSCRGAPDRETGPRALLHALHHYALWAWADFNLAVSTQTAKLPNLILQPLHALYVLWAWADFNLPVSIPTTKLPNLIPGQILRLYSIYSTLFEHYRRILPVAPWTLCTLRVQNKYTGIALFPGPAQLSVACSTEKRERAQYLFSCE